MKRYGILVAIIAIALFVDTYSAAESGKTANLLVCSDKQKRTRFIVPKSYIRTIYKSHNSKCGNFSMELSYPGMKKFDKHSDNIKNRLHISFYARSYNHYIFNQFLGEKWLKKQPKTSIAGLRKAEIDLTPRMKRNRQWIEWYYGLLKGQLTIIVCHIDARSKSPGICIAKIIMKRGYLLQITFNGQLLRRWKQICTSTVSLVTSFEVPPGRGKDKH